MTSSKKEIHPHLKTFWKVLFFLLGIYFVLLAWAGREFFVSGILQGRTLLVLTNENETRPCGGFVSAYGVIQFFPPKFFLKDSYAIGTGDLGHTTYPMNKVSATKNFWDLADTADVGQCAEQFQVAYEKLTHEKINHVMLVNFGTLESLGNLLGDPQFFATLSRSVANLDRHNIEALQNRKNPMKAFAKQLFFTSLYRPDIPLRVMNIVSENIRTGAIFSPELSPRIAPNPSDFSVVEWNLGGAKSSRYLEKRILIRARETSPQKWEINVNFSAYHAGEVDEPLSQNWKGAFEFRAPNFLGGKHVFWEGELAPGETFEKTLSFPFSGDLPHFGVFKPRGQQIETEVSFSFFPQQSITHANFPVLESVGHVQQLLNKSSAEFQWELLPDKLPPFVTIHELIPASSLPEGIDPKFLEGNLFSEIHFNEKIKLTPQLQAILRDGEKADHHPALQSFVLLGDERTLLFSFLTDQPNPASYGITISGIQDLWGNSIIPAERTLMVR